MPALFVFLLFSRRAVFRGTLGRHAPWEILRASAAHAAFDVERRALEARETGLREQIEAARQEILELRPKAEALAASRASHESSWPSAKKGRHPARGRAGSVAQRPACESRTRSAFVGPYQRLEAELRNERENMAEKIALLESASRPWRISLRPSPPRSLRRSRRPSPKPARRTSAPCSRRCKPRSKNSAKRWNRRRRIRRPASRAGDSHRHARQHQPAAHRGSSQSDDSAARLRQGAGRLGRIHPARSARQGRPARRRAVHVPAVVQPPTAETRARPTVRTDVILYLPGGRNLVIDSKVSLNAYTDCVNAATEEERKAALKLHMASVRGTHCRPGQGRIPPAARSSKHPTSS